MKTKFFCFFVLIIGHVYGQSDVKGVVADRASRQPLSMVDVLNLNTQQQVTSNAQGEFKIVVMINHLLVFSTSGYTPDTVLLIDLKPLRRYMSPMTSMLNTVTIKGALDFRAQYAETFNKANPILLKQGRGLLFYPSTFLGKEGKDARRFKKLLKQEEIEKRIDWRYNVKTVRAILPLEQRELDAFMVMYRPTLKFVLRADADDFKQYLLNAYHKFKLLPSQKRRLPSLKTFLH